MHPKSILAILFFSLIWLIGCNTADEPAPLPPTEIAVVTATPTAVVATAVNTPSPTQTPLPTTTSIPEVQEEDNTARPSIARIEVTPADLTATAVWLASATATFTPRPTNTPTPLPTATQPPPITNPVGTETIPTQLPAIGTAVPDSVQLTADNIQQIEKMAHWGKPRIRDAAYSPDGAIIYAHTGRDIYLYNAQTMQQIDQWRYTATISAMTISPDGSMLALSFYAENNPIQLHSTADNSLIRAWAGHGPWWFNGDQLYSGHLAFSADGTLLFSKPQDTDQFHRPYYVWQTDTGTPIFVTDPNANPAQGIDFATESKELFIKTENQVLKYDLSVSPIQPQEVLIEPMPSEYFEPGEISISPDGRYLLQRDAFWDYVGVWQTSDGQHLYNADVYKTGTYQPEARNSRIRQTKPARLTGPGRGVYTDIEFSSDSQYLLMADGFYQTRIIELQTGAIKQFWPSSGDTIVQSPTLDKIGIIRGTLVQWNTETGDYINELLQHSDIVTDLIAVPEQELLLIASRNGWVYERSLTNGALTRSFYTEDPRQDGFTPPGVGDIDISTNGRKLAIAVGNVFKIIDLTYGHTLADMSYWIHGNFGIKGIAFFDQDQHLLTYGYGNTALTFSTENGGNTANGFSQFSDSPKLIAVSNHAPDMLLIADAWNQPLLNLVSAADDGSFINMPLPLPNGRTVENLGVSAAVFSPDDSYLFAARSSGDIMIWEFENGIPSWSHTLVQSEKSNLSPQDIQFSGDGFLALIMSGDLIRIYHLEEERLVHEMELTGFNNMSATFSSDGRYIALGRSDGTVEIWGVRP